jgi:alpha-glucuronidase
MGDDVLYFEGTDPCWLDLDRLGALGRMTFSLLGADDDSVNPNPILATLAEEIGTLVDLHGGALVTDRLNGAHVILATQSTLAGLATNVAAPHSELISLGVQASQQLIDEGFVVIRHDGAILITAFSEQGLLYGYFHLLRHAATAAATEYAAGAVDDVTVENPVNPIRMVNQWDNMTVGDDMGSVERGYSGRSIFYADGQVVRDKSRITDYARLLASVGINASSPGATCRRSASIARPARWGFASPKTSPSSGTTTYPSPSGSALP